MKRTCIACGRDHFEAVLDKQVERLEGGYVLIVWRYKCGGQAALLRWPRQ